MSLLLAAAVALPAGADEPLPLVFEDDFSQGIDRWEPTDPAAWTLGKDGERAVWGLNKRKSSYEPKVRSPHNVALVKDLELSDTVITFQVKSTLDTGGHRDCCVFFNWQDPEHFNHELGARMLATIYGRGQGFGAQALPENIDALYRQLLAQRQQFLASADWFYGDLRNLAAPAAAVR